MKMNIDIQIQEKQDKILVIPSGEIDMSTSNMLRETLLNIVRKQKEAIVISLEKVAYIDSSGLATLVEGLQKTLQYGGSFKLIIKNQKILDVFKLARLNQIFDIVDSREAAGFE